MLSGMRPQIKYCLLSVVNKHIITSHFLWGARSASNSRRSAVSDLIFWGNKFLLRINYMSPVGLNVYFLSGKAGSTQSACALSVVYKNGSETCVQGVGTRGHEMRDVRMLSWRFKLQRPRRLRKWCPPALNFIALIACRLISSNVSNFSWSWVLKNFIEVQEKKKKVIVLSSRRSQNVKLGIFAS